MQEGDLVHIPQGVELWCETEGNENANDRKTDRWCLLEWYQSYISSLC